MPLSSKDYKGILEIIVKINAAHSRAEICKIFYEDIQGLVPFPAASLLSLDTSTYGLSQHENPLFLFNIPASKHNLWLDHYHKTDPIVLGLLSGALKNLKNEAVRYSDFTSPSRLEDTEFGCDFMPLLPFFYAASAILAPQGDELMAFGLLRPKDDRDFSDREKDILNLLLPHLSSAFHNLKLRDMVASLQGIGIVVIGVDGRPSYINELAADALNGRPIEAIPDPSGSTVPVYFQSERGVYRIRATQMGKGREKVIILAPILSDEHLESRSSTFGFSKRENQVVSLLSRGFSNKEIAERLFISEDTVKNHLRHIFEKAKVKSRSKLMSKVLGFRSR